jgi:predicted DNA-binding WGR domain protein
VCGLIDVWLNGRVVPAKPERAPVVCSVFAMIRRAKTEAHRKGRGLHEDSRALLASFSARAHAVARAMVLKRSCTPLATPTHRGGWVEPWALVQRLNAATKVDSVDLAQALLRVAFEERPRAVAKLKPAAPHAELVRYALGGKASAPKGPLAACAHVAREGRPSVEYALTVAKRRYENRNVGGFRDEFKTVEVTATLPKELRGSLAETLLDTAQALDGFRDYEATTPTLVGSMWPGNLPAVYARGVRLVADDFDEGRHRQHSAFVELLRSDHESMGRVAVLLLGVALASPSADVRSLAVEALAVGITSGRFDPEREDGSVARTLGELLALDVLVTKRWAKALADVAGRSALHRAVVRALVTRWLQSGQAAHLGKDLGNVLDLVYEGAVEDRTAIDAPSALEFLASLSGSDLAAKAAKRLLALSAAASVKPSKPAAATQPARATRPHATKPREVSRRKLASKPGPSGRKGTTPRRFELVDGKSKKFWSIARSGERLALEWGRLGTKGQVLEKHFDTESEAQREYDKLVSEKTKKGYLEV